MIDAIQIVAPYSKLDQVSPLMHRIERMAKFTIGDRVRNRGDSFFMQGQIVSITLANDGQKYNVMWDRLADPDLCIDEENLVACQPCPICGSTSATYKGKWLEGATLSEMNKPKSNGQKSGTPSIEWVCNQCHGHFYEPLD